jgi:hypothetical protein
VRGREQNGLKGQDFIANSDGVIMILNQRKTLYPNGAGIERFAFIKD